MMSHNRIRVFNKHYFNRLIRTFAGRYNTPFAMIHHVGRRSGKAYATPIIVEPLDDGFVIALTYGPEVDWYRNLQAADHSTLLWHGHTYVLDKPRTTDPQTALPAFPAPLRPILRLLGTQDFVRVQAQRAVPAGNTSA
jgi:deazaflavin-dependent oxidoreductase (nitroreductase family)